MQISNFTLIKKTSLTSDIFELDFKSDIKSDSKAWQFITFLLPLTKFWRAYCQALEKLDTLYYTKNQLLLAVVKMLENHKKYKLTMIL